MSTATGGVAGECQLSASGTTISRSSSQADGQGLQVKLLILKVKQNSAEVQLEDGDFHDYCTVSPVD